MKFAMALVAGLSWAACTDAAQAEVRPRVVVQFAPGADCAEQAGEQTSPDLDVQSACEHALRETATRLQGELAGAGLDVTLLETADSGGPVSRVDESGSENQLLALLAVTQLGGRPAIRVASGHSDRSFVLTLEVSSASPARVPALLAVRALELLRAQGIVLGLPSAAAQDPDPGQPAPAPERAAVSAGGVRSRPDLRTTVAVAPALLYGFRALAPQLAPLVSLALGKAVGLGGRVLLAGPSTGALLSGRHGAARITQGLAALMLDYCLTPAPRLSIVFGAGAGVHLALVDGRAEAPYQARSETLWSAMMLLGMGLRVPLHARLFVLADAFGYVTQPSSLVKIANEPGSKLGPPSVLAALGIGLRL